MKTSYIKFYLLLFSFQLFQITVIAQTVSNVFQKDKIIFLKLIITETDARLIEARLVDGKFKQPREKLKNYGIQYQLLDTSGNILNEGYESDPIYQRYEFVNDQGELVSTGVSQKNAPILIRIPYHERAERIRLNRIKPISTTARKKNLNSETLDEYKISEIIF